jgi:hypothetical protein
MQTRSQTNKSRVEFSVEIDFDKASRAWLANKRRLGNGTYEYKKIVEAPTQNKYNLRSREIPY